MSKSGDDGDGWASGIPAFPMSNPGSRRSSRRDSTAGTGLEELGGGVLLCLVGVD